MCLVWPFANLKDSVSPVCGIFLFWWQLRQIIHLGQVQAYLQAGTYNRCYYRSNKICILGTNNYCMLVWDKMRRYYRLPRQLFIPKGLFYRFTHYNNKLFKAFHPLESQIPWVLDKTASRYWLWNSVIMNTFPKTWASNLQNKPREALDRI